MKKQNRHEDKAVSDLWERERTSEANSEAATLWLVFPLQPTRVLTETVPSEPLCWKWDKAGWSSSLWWFLSTGWQPRWGLKRWLGLQSTAGPWVTLQAPNSLGSARPAPLHFLFWPPACSAFCDCVSVCVCPVCLLICFETPTEVFEDTQLKSLPYVMKIPEFQLPTHLQQLRFLEHLRLTP